LGGTVKIAHVTDCYLPRLGGIELQVADLARRQHRMGHDVTVVTSVAADVAADADFAGVTVRRPPAPSNAGRDGAIRYVSSLTGRSVVLSGQFDAVHVHASTFSPLAFLTAAATSRAGIPTAVTVHSLWSYATPLFRAANSLCGWAEWPVAWSAVSTVAATPLRRILRDRAPVTVLPNGIEPAQWLQRREPASLTNVRLISVMRLAKRKRPRELLSILRQVADRVGPSIQLSAEIIGDGPQRPMLERYLQRHDMAGWVRLAGRATRTQINEALCHADIFLSPATLESFGIAALEARSAGLPVIARAGTGVEDFISHHREGLLAHSDAEMVTSIVELIDSPAVRMRIRAHNTAVPPTIAWHNVLARCETLYQQALAAQSYSRIRRVERRYISTAARR
jgi:glycosyltransferase involved in cell wall biosynthesis